MGTDSDGVSHCHRDQRDRREGREGKRGGERGGRGRERGKGRGWRDYKTRGQVRDVMHSQRVWTGVYTLTLQWIESPHIPATVDLADCPS